MKEKGNPIMRALASLIRKSGHTEEAHAGGFYEVECFDKDGKFLWRDTIKNTVMTAGKNLALDTLMAGSNYSVTGPYMGLISSVDYSAIAAADVMNSHAGWKEAGATNAPAYTAPRKTCAFSAANAGAKALSSALAFVCATTGGTVKGCFVVLGANASSTIDNTSGTLYSAGLFTGGDKTLGDGDTLNVSYTASL